ncbi:MAG: hypothetical protein ACE5IK_10690 [Acidobacteriota bacterium]
MKRSLMMVLLLAAGLTGASPAQAQMRPDCLDPDVTPGACFVADLNFGAGFADPEGDALSLKILDGDSNDFFRVKPDGSFFLHGQSNQVAMVACRAANFPACLFDPSLLLFGQGTWVFAGSASANLFPQCPFAMHVDGLVSDQATGEQFRVQATLVASAAPNDPTCSAFGGDTRVFDIKIVPSN